MKLRSSFLPFFVLLIANMIPVSCQSDKELMKQSDFQRIAFTHANVVPMTTDTVLIDYTVIVDKGMIVSMGAFDEIAVPEGFKKIDIHGKYLMPGLIDMHVHVSDDADMLKFVQHGVTTVRNMSDVPWWTRMMGFANILKLREQQQRRQIIGPDIYTCGYTLDGDPPVSPMNKRITSEKEAQKEIAKEKQRGYDAIKLYDNLSFSAYKSVVAAAAKAGMPVAGHVPHAVPLKELFQDPIISIEHLTGYIDNKTAEYSIPKEKIEEYLALNRKSGIYNVPTLAVWACMPPENGIDSLKNSSQYKGLSWHIRWMWKTALPYYYDISYPDRKGYTQHMLNITSDLTYRLYKAGCPLLIGTDTNIAGTYVGETTWIEMELFVKAGIPVYETLRSATVLPARALGKEKEIGTIEPGKRANLIIIGENPLDNISHIRGVQWIYSNGYLIESRK
ncbi:MAG TPA: amidohydrolase family protein [Bacteroidales bacterium]|nr:amidohydrolase family protein [Bacteroidales bacterium]